MFITIVFIFSSMKILEKIPGEVYRFLYASDINSFCSVNPLTPEVFCWTIRIWLQAVKKTKKIKTTVATSKKNSTHICQKTEDTL